MRSNEKALPFPSHNWSRTRLLGLGVASTLAVAGLAQVKWLPLGSGLQKVLESPSIPRSILSGDALLPPPPSWEAGLGYTRDYFGAVWLAVILGILLGGAVMALLPSAWIRGHLGGSSLGAVLRGGASALPAMF